MALRHIKPVAMLLVATPHAAYRLMHVLSAYVLLRLQLTCTGRDCVPPRLVATVLLSRRTSVRVYVQVETVPVRGCVFANHTIPYHGTIAGRARSVLVWTDMMCAYRYSHTQRVHVLSYTVVLILTGWDLWGENKARIVAAAEFHASLMSDEPHPYYQKAPSWLTCTGTSANSTDANSNSNSNRATNANGTVTDGDNITHVNAAARAPASVYPPGGGVIASNGSTFEVIHHHFHTRLGIPMPNVSALLPKIRYGLFVKLRA